MSAEIWALSLSRPWTELILGGVKDRENRTWQTKHRGPLVIHGAQSWDITAIPTAEKVCPDWLDRLDLTKGCSTGFLGVVDLVGCHHADDLECQLAVNDHQPIGSPALGKCSPWGFDWTAHWVLANPRRFAEPILGNGRLGLFRPPPEVVAACAELGVLS